MSDNKPNATVVPLSLDNYIVGIKRPDVDYQEFEDWAYSVFGGQYPCYDEEICSGMRLQITGPGTNIGVYNLRTKYYHPAYSNDTLLVKGFFNPEIYYCCDSLFGPETYAEVEGDITISGDSKVSAMTYGNFWHARYWYAGDVGLYRVTYTVRYKCNGEEDTGDHCTMYGWIDRQRPYDEQTCETCECRKM